MRGAIGHATTRRSPIEATTTTDRPDLTAIPSGARTRFAPAPTGFLHVGHVANAIWTWGVAGLVHGNVLLRIEDHDRQRCRTVYDDALVEDLRWLGFIPDEGPVRQSDPPALGAYDAARAELAGLGLVYGCTCTRSTLRTWAATNGCTWSGPGCPGDCRDRGLDGPVLRVDLGAGSETWVDALLGPRGGDVARAGDLPIRDRHGNWTYGFTVVVDDLRHGIDLVIRGQDLLAATPAQIRLARRLGRADPPIFLHHPLVRRPDGAKLSKSSGDSGVRDLRAAGLAPSEVVALAGAAVGRPADPPGSA